MGDFCEHVFSLCVLFGLAIFLPELYILLSWPIAPSLADAEVLIGAELVELEELVEIVEVLIGVEVDFSLSVSSDALPARTHTHIIN